MPFCLGSNTRSTRAPGHRRAPSLDRDAALVPCPSSPNQPAPLHTLDHRDTSILKGLAISAIVMHNFFHFVSPVHQNEFTFRPARFFVFLLTVIHPSLAIQAFFSFFGHFGVQIFIFLSAYGLSRSHWDSGEYWTAFVSGRVRKLYPTFLLVIIPWFLAIAVRLESWQFVGHLALEMGATLLGISTLIGYGLPPVGPWWFIPFIVQFYALWPLLRKLTRRFGWRGLLIVAVSCLLLCVTFNPVLAHWHINLFETPVGRMPVLCFGILAARYPIRIPNLLALAALCVLCLGSLLAAFWPLTFLAATIVILWAYFQLRSSLRSYPVLEQLGECSIFLFLINGIVRDQFVGYASSPQSQLFFGFVSAAVSVLLAVLIQKYFRSARRRSARRLAEA